MNLKQGNKYNYLNTTGKVHSIETLGTVDGPGIRYVLFLQGCPLRCLYCHNPDTWSFKEGVTKTVNEIVEDVKLYKNFLRGGGVTISGGEPLGQPRFVDALVRAFNDNNIHVALDTSAAYPIKFSKKIFEKVDLVLLDIKALNEKLATIVSGIDNQNLFDTINYLESINKPVWIRHVILPGYTDSEESLHEIADYIKGFKNIEKVELLSFHKFGEFKWQELGFDYKLYNINEPTNEEYKKAVDIFRSYGLNA